MKRWLLVFLACLSTFAMATTDSAVSGSWENSESGTVLHLMSDGQLLIVNGESAFNDYFGQQWQSTTTGIEFTYLSSDNRVIRQELDARATETTLEISGNTPVSGSFEKTARVRNLIHVTLGRYRGPETPEFATVLQYNISNEIVAIDHFNIRNVSLPESFSIIRPTDSVRSTTYLSTNEGAFAYALGSTNSRTLRLLAWSATEAGELQTLYYGDVTQPDGTSAQVRLHLYDNGQFSRFTRNPTTDEEAADEGNYQRDGDEISLFSYQAPPTIARQVGSDMLTVESPDGNIYMGQYSNKLNAFPLDGPIARFDGVFFPRQGQNGEAGALNLISCSNGQAYTLVPSRTVQQMIGQFQTNPSRGFIQVSIRAHRVPTENGTDSRFWVTDWYRDQAPGECGKGMQAFGQMMAAQGQQ